MVHSQRFDGLQILIVEDNYFVASALAQRIQDYGAIVVGPVATLQSALELVETHGSELNGASLDINLNGRLVFPVADALLARAIPIVFSTGYDVRAIPENYRDIPRCEKPVNSETVARELLERAAQHRQARAADGNPRPSNSRRHLTPPN
jgi:DNA-binding LytR/AlgR family response regulator